MRYYRKYFLEIINITILGFGWYQIEDDKKIAGYANSNTKSQVSFAKNLTRVFLKITNPPKFNYSSKAVLFTAPIVKKTVHSVK